MARLDVAGAATIIAAVCCLLLTLQWGGTTLPWSSSIIIELFIGFGLLLIAFGALQWKLGDKATIPLRVVRQRSVFLGCCYSFFVSMSNYSVSCP